MLFLSYTSRLVVILFIIIFIDVLLQMLKRGFRIIFLYEFKLGGNAAKTARNINEVWGQEVSANLRSNVGSRSFVLATPALKMNLIVAAQRPLTTINWRCQWKPIHAQRFRHSQKSSTYIPQPSVVIWSKWESQKKTRRMGAARIESKSKKLPLWGVFIATRMIRFLTES